MQQLDLLVAEPHELHERHVLVRHRDEEALDHRLVGTAPVAPGQLLVLATPGANAVPSLVAELPRLLSDFMPGVESVWVGVGRLAASAEAVVALAEKLGVEVVAPDGGVAVMPGGSLYAGHSAGGNGWFRFAPDGSASFYGSRFPLPSWESWVPAEPLEVAGVSVTPAPCGLVVSGSADVAFDVPVNQRFPKVVVCGPLPSPSVVAELLGNLPDKPVMIVPAVPEAANHVWQTGLAVSLSRDVVFSAGTQVRTDTGEVATIVPDGSGGRLFQPFPLVLGQSARGGDQKVLEIAAPPPGWERVGRRSYRPMDGSGAIADVVPSGMVLRAEDDEPAGLAAEAAPFDPEGWTLALGTSGQPVGLHVLAAAEQLLAALPDGQRAAARVRVVGTMDEKAEHALDRFAAARRQRAAAGASAGGPGTSDVDERQPGSGVVVAAGERTRAVAPERREADARAPTTAGASAASTVALPAIAGSAGGGSDVESSTVALPAVGAPADAASTDVTAQSAVRADVPPVTVLPAGMSPIMTTSGAPVSTVSASPSFSPSPVRQPEHIAREPEHEAERPCSDDSAVPAAESEPLVRESSPQDGSAAQGPTAPGAPPVPGAVPGQGVPSVQGPPVEAPQRPSAGDVVAQAEPMRQAPAGKPLAVPARDSTTSEQTRFTAAAGEHFSQALATVNAAMATWPSMRADESAGAKADYVAVCLFLGRGTGDASSVNGAVRVGQTGVIDAQIPCLMSGIRRLPTQRRAVLRQGKVNESLEHSSAPGTILTEPGFLAASIDLDVTMPGADLDVLIWPSTARRTSELVHGRPVDEAVFPAGARFKALAVRTAAEDDEDEESEDDGALSAPRVAVLYRELAPGETPATTELDERDLAVLAKLDSVLARRHRGTLRLVEDPGVVARLTTSMVAWQQEVTEAVAS